MFQLISAKHAKETVEKSRIDNLTTTIENYRNREIELANAIVQLQTHHCKLPNDNMNLYTIKSIG